MPPSIVPAPSAIGLVAALYHTDFLAVCRRQRERGREYQIAKGAVWEMKRVKQAGNDNITTIAALAEKAKESPLGNHFITTVRPKDLPECWGIKFDQIYLPGCDIGCDTIK